MDADAQCSNFDANYPSGLYTTTNTNWRFVTNNAYGGEYARYNVVAGATYHWTNCYGSGFNSQLTIWDAAHTTALAFSSNGCGGGRANIDWTATFTGEVHVLITQDNCQSITSNATIYWRMLSPPPPHPFDEPCDAELLAVSSSCVFSTYDNNGATATSIGNPSCGVYNGGDIWFRAVVPASGSLVVDTQEGTLLYGSMAIYQGTCNSLTEIACDDFSGNGYMPRISLAGLTPGSTIFIRFFAYNNNAAGTFDICVWNPCSGPPTNDIPCNAISLSMGTGMQGHNYCATGNSEPATPSCWSNSNSSVWYSFVASSTGSTRIIVFPEDIGSTQVALYEGTCSGLSELQCGTSEPMNCEDGSSYFSQIESSGLNPGQTYYLRVDGQDGDQGQFMVRVNSWLRENAINAQDCSGAIQLCGNRTYVADPGFQGVGFECDFDGNNNCTGGEKNSVWYRVKAHANGTFRMVITPNDGNPSSCGSETDYDFLVWKIAGSGTTTDCEGIKANPSIGLLACNYSADGITGVWDGGNAPGGHATCFNDAFEPTFNLQSGDEILIVVQNWDTSTSGFELDMGSSAPGMIGVVAPTTVYWDGRSDESWTDAANWGDCSTTPSCTVNAIIPPSGDTHPIVEGTQRVKNLTILPGGTLELNANSILRICGEFKNYGTIVAHPTSTILFNGGANHTIEGSLTGDNAIGNLTISKSAGEVVLNSAIELKGSFASSNNASKFNINGNTLSVSRNFSNFNGNSTFYGIGTTATLEFIGGADQRYYQGLSNLYLNDVVMSKSGNSFVQLFTDMILRTNEASLKLNHGVIRTTGAYQVEVYNSDPNSVNEGNEDSYVDGTLYRRVNNNGVYEFPVGNTTSGYQRAQIDLIANSVNGLTANFNNWSASPPVLNLNDCMTTFDMPALDNGFFKIEADANATTAVYDMKLFNYNFGNAYGSGYTIMKDSGSGYQLSGTCENSTSNEVHRTGMTGFSNFATAQSVNPLPVELLAFEGEVREDGNLLYWSTASEVNNERFDVQRSMDGIEFVTLGSLAGAGNSSTVLAYQFVDESVPLGEAYYRLKQVDFDGTTDFSDIILLNRSEEIGMQGFRIFPNPTNGLLNLQFIQLYEERLLIEVIDSRGSRAFKKTLVSQEGLNTIKLKLNRLSEGLYYLRVGNLEGQSYNERKFTIQH